MKKELFVNLAAFLLCGTFCLSAVSKIIFWSDTVMSLDKLFLNEKVAIFSTIVIIMLEISIAIALFFPQLWKLLGLFSSIILVIFTCVALWGKISGRIGACPCFGNLFGAEIGITLVLRNIFLISLSIITLYSNRLLTKKTIN